MYAIHFHDEGHDSFMGVIERLASAHYVVTIDDTLLYLEGVDDEDSLIARAYADGKPYGDPIAFGWEQLYDARIVVQ